ncbi:unnamed protein product [Acanthoscelides obtectus]|uniref:Ribosomal RNA-processing protein 14/surfeit locus protein 6 C-terminal domain-containing protein n=1 Tax=Acanthoscelides obtectus TaxID=200917 RepID=A0A9P0KAN9_ACAOB|nr:unnamed protein product [Acanthoscelides obtectus]CAK1680195.1 Surfeit locus protein 6 homolog [Acanthoscelides obtectus]
MAKKIEEFLRSEGNFIMDLLQTAGVPDRRLNDDDENDEGKANEENSFKKASRARSLQELQDRLERVKGKKKMNYREKLEKKKLKNQLKKKTKKSERHANHKLSRAAKLSSVLEKSTEMESDTKKPDKPVYNKDEKLVFSKFDFAEIGKKKKVKKEKDPKKILENLEKQNEKINKLKESGEIEKAIEIKEKNAWKNALAKAEGQKIKDDPLLLKKSVKKKEQKQRSSKKKWEQRIQGVEKAKQDRQQKRKDNIQKRKKDKKTTKLKKAAKRGKIIPGF